MAVVSCPQDRAVDFPATQSSSSSNSSPSQGASDAGVRQSDAAQSTKKESSFTYKDLAAWLLGYYRRLPNGDLLRPQDPPADRFNGELSESQVRWCIYESVRLADLRKNFSNPREKILIDTHKILCGSAKIRSEIEKLIVSELGPLRQLLRQQGKLAAELFNSDEKHIFLIPWHYYKGSVRAQHFKYVSQFSGSLSECERHPNKQDSDVLYCIWRDTKVKTSELVRDYLIPSAIAGNSYAAMEYYIVLRRGVHVDKNEDLAGKFLKIAADAENVAALIDLGWAHLQGLYGIEKDYSKALVYTQKAAKLEHGEALSNLGLMYEFGYGVKTDFAKAVEYYEKALKTSGAWSGQAQVRLANLLSSGKGVPRDVSRAVILLNEVSNNSRMIPELRAEAATKLVELQRN